MITVWKGQSANHKLNFNLFIIKITLLITDFTLRPSFISQLLCSLASPSSAQHQAPREDGTHRAVTCLSPGHLVSSTSTGWTTGDPHPPPSPGLMLVGWYKEPGAETTPSLSSPGSMAALSRQPRASWSPPPRGWHIAAERCPSLPIKGRSYCLCA